MLPGDFCILRLDAVWPLLYIQKFLEQKSCRRPLRKRLTRLAFCRWTQTELSASITSCASQDLGPLTGIWGELGDTSSHLDFSVLGLQVDSEKAVSRAYELAQEAKIWDRKLGLAGIWGKLVREWLDDILPCNAAEICRTRLRLVVTQLPSIAPVAVQDFASRQELIDATMASVHVPFFLDGRPAVRFRGKLCIDGSLGDFLTKSNSELLQCKGRRSLMLDYYDDDQLSYSRFDFLKLRSYEDVLRLVKQGEAYAQRLDQAGKLEQIFPKRS